ncbi:MAG: T9SS type A sorting domain-containing protein [Bacteroidetes bacterium]|nr:T9SS type A sorting domain-containing protein [Bacteroidota bacterium]
MNPDHSWAATITSNAVTGIWSTGATWVGGVAPAAGDNAIIVNGATITVSGGAASITNVTINTGGTLITTSSLTVNAAGTFTIQAGGLYRHNNIAVASTRIFNGTENFDPASTVRIDNWSATSTPLINSEGSNFGNLILNWNAGSLWNNSGLGTGVNLIQGNFTVQNSCATYLNISAGNISITIGGDFSILTNGYVEVKRAATGNVTFIVNGVNGTTISGANSNFYGVTNQGGDATGDLTFSTSKYTQTAGSFIGTYGTNLWSNPYFAGGSINFTCIGAFLISGGQHVGISWGYVGNWGIATYSIGNFSLTGGLILFTSTVVTDGRANTLNCTNDCSINFSAATDFFLFNNLTGGGSNSVYNFSVGGNLTIAGNTTALFKIKQDGTGNDNIAITGNLTISGGKNQFSDLTPALIAMTNTLSCTIGGNVSISGGATAFSTIAASKIDLMVGTSSVNWSQTGGTMSLCKTNIKSGKTVTLTGSKMGDIQAGRAITVETGAKLYCSNYPVSGSGLFTLSTGATLGIGSAAGVTSAGATGNIQVTGARSYNTGATYEFYEGLTPQSTGNFTTTTTTGTYPSQVANLIINKTLATNIVNLTNTTDVNTLLTLTNGVLTTSFTSATAPWIRIPTDVASVSPIGGSANSYVDGYIRKTGSSAFIFPTGNGVKWRRIAMTAPSMFTEFEARYISAAYANTTTFAGSPTPTLNHVSTLEHWYLSKPLGANAATTKVTLYWENAAASAVLQFDSLAVGRWSGAAWENTNCYGSCPANWTSSQPERTYTGSATGTGAGTIQSNTISSFSPFTLVSIGSYNLNPLPIELLSNEVNCSEKNVLIKWTTASEKNNNFFTIEKSIDGTIFFDIGNISGAGNSTNNLNYSFIDYNAYNGTSYYRLKQTDYNGDSKTFNIITSENCNTSAVNINAFNDQTGNIAIVIDSDINANYTATLFDAIGKKINSNTFDAVKGNNTFELDASNLKSGIYFISIDNGKEKVTKKIFIF